MRTETTLPQDRRINKNITSNSYRPSGDKFLSVITIEDKSPEKVFEFCRDFRNLPKFIKGISSIEPLTETSFRWHFKGTAAGTNCKISTLDEPHEKIIRWENESDSEIATMGQVSFSTYPACFGTIVRVLMSYSIVSGKLTELVTKLKGEDPKTATMSNLRRLKALLETGEIPTIEGQPSGREENLKNIFH